MADDTFRSRRNRDPLPRDEVERIESDANDPLAELARLIGQSDPYAEGRRSESYDSYSAEPAENEAEADRGRAADEGFAEEQYDRADDRYAPRQAESYPPYEAELRVYQNEPSAGGGHVSGPAPQFAGFREDGDADYRAEQMPVLRPQEFPAYPRVRSDREYEAEELNDAGEPYAEHDYYDEPARPRRRTGLVVIMAVLGLAVIGTAGAFGYRAMFGGSVLPTLPPIIKANDGPNKIVPNSDSQANNAGSPTGAASGASAEHLVSREEQPVNMEQPKTVPRVVSTIPIVPGQSSPPPAAPGAVSAPAWPNPPPAGATQWPNPPAPSATPSTAAVQPAPAPAQDSPQSTAPAPPAQASTAPKRIHTVVIHSDQPGKADTASDSAQAQQAAPAPQPAPRSATRPAPATPAATPKASAASGPSAGGSAPLSLVPSAQGEAAPASAGRSRTPSAPMHVASAGSASGVAAAPSSGGGYAVQVTSQRSEAEAQTAFKELRAKYPNQLGGREPIIRRADLGAKGTYYRALVGPFASMEEAAGMCSGLKAAGGNCLVQKN